MYSFMSRVRYSECDEKQNITFHALLDYFQDCCTFQSEDLGVGVDYLEESKTAWILSAWQVVVNEYPRLGTRIKISTWPYEFDKFLGYRNFTMEDEQGRVLAYANSVWVFMNMEKKRPAKISERMMQAYHDKKEKPFEMEYASRKIIIPEKRVDKEPFAVLKSDIDTNHHVNNGKYISMAEEFLPEGYRYKQMRAEYLKAAVLGDVIYPSVTVDEKSAVVVLADEKGTIYSAVEFLEEQKEC